MDNRLVKFLRSRETEKGVPFSHTSKIKPCRRYYIGEEDLDEFYEIYNQVIHDGGIAGLTEMPGEIVPLIVDIDFRCTLDNGIKRYYKPKHVKDVISIYQEIIAEIAENPTERMMYCCVLEKTSPVAYQGKCKDGFHLHFPFFFTEKWVQKEFIRSEVIRRVEERKVFEDIPMFESLDKVFDKNIPTAAWLLYGSRKEPKAEPYQLTKRYNKDLELLPLKSMFKKLLPGGSREFNLPRYLSIRQNVSATLLRDDAITKKEPQKYNTKNIIRQRDDAEVLSDIVLARHLVDMLDSDRADDYTTWMEIGWILYNISEGRKDGLDLWIEFSKRSPKFVDKADCKERWYKMEMKNFTLATLKYLAKHDSPNEYLSWRDERAAGYIQQGLNLAHNDLAHILYMLFENQFICADIEKELWYEFKDHRWQRDPKGMGLRKHISHTLADKYASLCQFYMQQFQGEADMNQRTLHQQNALKAIKVTDKLKNNSFKNSIMKEAMEYFYDKEFVEKMDENPHLLVCKNGVYDSENRIFRDGRPDDYCTKSTGIYYREFDDDDPCVMELRNIFEKIFINKKLFKFFRQTTSDLILGGNRHKIFIIWTNVAGNNGKSVCADLLEYTFGDYFYTPPTSMLTGKQSQSASATADLIPTKGARVVVVSETGNEDVLNCGTMKKLTGGDPFYARGLFKDPIKITPQFKLILHCNGLPNISAEDKASWNRIRVLPFESEFVKKEDAPKSIKEQYRKKIFPMDKSLKDRLKDLAEPFLWWLIRDYESYGDSDLYQPSEVTCATDIYHKSNDFYLQFIDERIQQTDDKKAYVTLSVIYSLFKEWYKDSFPGQKISSRIQVKEALIKKWGEPVKGIWRGYRTFDPDEEIDSEEEEEEDYEDNEE